MRSRFVGLTCSVLVLTACGTQLGSRELGSYTTSGTVDTGSGAKPVTSVLVSVSEESGATVNVSVAGLPTLTATATSGTALTIAAQTLSFKTADGGTAPVSFTGGATFSDGDQVWMQLNVSGTVQDGTLSSFVTSLSGGKSQ